MEEHDRILGQERFDRRVVHPLLRIRVESVDPGEIDLTKVLSNDRLHVPRRPALDQFHAKLEIAGDVPCQIEA